MSPENRQRRSEAMAQRQMADPRLRQGYSRTRGGRRQDLDNQYFRSGWEANFARYLNFLKKQGEIREWKYEAFTFWFEKIKRGVRSYTPDFAVWEHSSDPENPDYFYEVKGYHHQRGKTALDRMKRYHPDVKIVLLDEDAYKAIKKYKALIPEWE